MTYHIPEELDVTKVYLKSVLEGKVSDIKKLHKSLEKLHIDRLVQAVIDSELQAFEVRSHLPGYSEQVVGMEKMGRTLKRFLSNLAHLSKVAEEEDLGEDETLEYLASKLDPQDIAIAERR